MVNVNPKLISCYNRIFPHSSFRRFLFSEFIKFTSNLLYYGTLLTGISFILSLFSYINFHIVNYFLDIETHPLSIMSELVYGFVFGFFESLFCSIVIGTIMNIYECDYLNWVKPAQTEIDPENLLESNPNKCKSLFLTLFPYYSVRRYLLIRGLALMLIVLGLILYVYLCYKSIIYIFGYQWIYKNDPSTGKTEEIPFPVVLLICFLLMSSFVGFLGCFIALVVLYYKYSWKQYQDVAQQVVAKEN